MILKETIENFKTASNKELHEALTFLKSRHEQNKEKIIEITHQIDLIEKDYNKLYNEYRKRNKGLK